MGKDYRLTVDETLDPCPASFALIWAEGIDPPTQTIAPPPFLQELLDVALTKGEDFVPLPIRQRVRTILRHGKYKPSGRGKPASEFLFRAALGDTFPLVNGPVDVNNTISLASGFPGSVFDSHLSGRHLLIRRGTPTEEYVFNPSGQTIDLQDLLLICRETETGWEPCGNPVKDAMITKISADTTDIIAVLYIPVDEPSESVTRWAQLYADRLSAHCNATHSGYAVIAAPIAD